VNRNSRTVLYSRGRSGDDPGRLMVSSDMNGVGVKRATGPGHWY
jgi:hypothetical protein